GASETQVVHGAGAGGGNAVRQRSGEGPQEDVHDALGSLNIARGHGGGRSRVHYTSFGGSHLDRRHQAGRGGDVFAEQGTEDVENRRGRDGEHRIHAASAGGRRSGEVHCSALAASADRDAQAHRAGAGSVVVEESFCRVVAVGNAPEGLAEQGGGVAVERFEVG